MTVASSRRPSRRLLVAAAGYGKTTALEEDLPAGGIRCTATEALDRGVPHADWVAVDDVHELSEAEQAELVGMLAELPSRVSVTVASRRPLAGAVRGRLLGQVYERGPEDLALSAYAVARVLADEYGVVDPTTAVEVHACTDGWPALVHFAADALARHRVGDLCAELGRPGSAASTWLTMNVLRDVPSDVLAVLTVVTGLGPVTEQAWRVVSRGAGLRASDRAVEHLRRVGVLVPRRRLGREPLLTVVPLVGAVLAAGPAAPEPDAALLAAVAATYERDGLPFAAAQAHARASRWSELERLVARRGDEMLRAGHAAGLARLLAEAPPTAVSSRVQPIRADALRVAGDPSGALRLFGPVADEADLHGWSEKLAVRVASVHFMLGDFPAAVEALDRISGSQVTSDLDGVEWRAARVLAVSMRGVDDGARALAAEALRLAERVGEPGGLALAHLAVARTSDGAVKEAHHERALSWATRAGDVPLAARVMVNQGHLLLASARYGEATVVAREALWLTERFSPPGVQAAALHNLGEALTMVGELPEARWQLERAVALCRRLGPGRAALGLLGIAQVHRHLGHDEQARAAYLEAVALARESGELQVLVPALAGLARLEAASSAESARSLADEAMILASDSVRPFALVAGGWVALLTGDRERATEHAAEAVDAAREVQAVDVLAEALELAAECALDPAAARRALVEALSIWREGGAEPASARLEVLLGGLSDADGTARSRGREAARRLQRMGIHDVNGRPLAEERSMARVAVRVLGGFSVQVDGRVVALTAWRSRQARTLVKILASRRGRPTTRAQICELLWPDDDPARTSHRLSVLLAAVRGVLDPARAWPGDRYVASDLTGIRLDLRHVAVDAENLLRDAEHAAELMEAGEVARAAEILASVDEQFRGEAFEEDLYEEWADPLREEVRAAWLRSLRRLATLRARQDRVEDAQGLLVRLLAVDPYDEQVHAMLVGTLSRNGRHGEARRAFERWVEAMRAIEAPPPDARVLRASVPSR